MVATPPAGPPAAPPKKLSPADVLAAVEPVLRPAALRAARAYGLDYGEVVQDARVRVLERSAAYDPGSPFAHMFARDAVRDVVRDVRRARRLSWKCFERRVQALTRREPSRDDDLRPVIANDTAERVRAAIADLEPELADVVCRLHGIGYRPAGSVRQLARDLGVQPEACGRLVRVAEAKLRELLRPRPAFS